MKSEAAFAAWWGAGGASNQPLQTTDGRALLVRFPGRRGGPVGPDFRDAVIEIAGHSIGGDIELHLRAADWLAHGHHRDPRYDGVILHVVTQVSPTQHTPLCAGGTVPIVNVAALLASPPQQPPPQWPCQRDPLAPDAFSAALARWGRVRFQGRVVRYAAELRGHTALLETVLLAGIAEALGYGRDPQLTRAAALGATSEPRDQLSARRLRGWRTLAAHAAEHAMAARCCGALLAGGEAHGWQRLIDLVGPGGDPIGRPRAAIVVWNVVLPCLAAFGELTGNQALVRLAWQVAGAAPGLPANAITRSMSAWLGLRHPPGGALAQQGLQHLHARWCRAKDCVGCPLAVRATSDPLLAHRDPAAADARVPAGDRGRSAKGRRVR